MRLFECLRSARTGLRSSLQKLAPRSPYRVAAAAAATDSRRASPLTEAASSHRDKPLRKAIAANTGRTPRSDIMPGSTLVSPASITKADFSKLLDRYPALIASLSKAKPAKAGQKTLQELDQYRFVHAPRLFSGPSPADAMGKQAVETLVQWKLSHGKFRPTLMGLVSSNPAPLVARTVASGLAAYRAGGEDATAAALAELVQLRGIGPATASLLLAVHDPDRVIFLSDEAFEWLCGRPGVPVKYSAGEYRRLAAEAKGLAARLGVGAVDIEKVAYVLVKGAKDGSAPGPERAAASKRKRETAEVESFKPRMKRNGDADDGVSQRGQPVRRSKRLRK